MCILPGDVNVGGDNYLGIAYSLLSRNVECFEASRLLAGSGVPKA
jgi:hypothetical protein